MIYATRSIALGFVLTISLTSFSVHQASTSTPFQHPVTRHIKAASSLRSDTISTFVSRKIGEILNDSIFASCFIGAEVVSLEGGKIFFERNSHKLFHPASNMKLLTSAAALNLLPDSFCFTTRVFAKGKIRDGLLNGNLCIKGSGDPLLATEDLDSIAIGLRKVGIRSVTGDLVGNVSYFDSLRWGHGWMWDDEPDANEAFISALTVNDNSVRLYVQPNKKIDTPPIVTLDPSTSYVSFVNDAITSIDSTIAQLSVSRPSGTNTITLRGRMAPGDGSQTIDVSVSRPEMYFLHLLRERLSARGIEVQGTLRLDTLQEGIELCRYSHPIDSVLSLMNKTSDNIAAENMLKALAAEKHGTPGNTAEGLNLVKGYLANEGIDTTAMMLADGSGVSWYNAVTPTAIVQLLRKQYEQATSFERFYHSLSIAGVDGTLRNRMRGTRAAGNVHAKTGSLSGNSALSGYVTSADGKMLAFSILFNHFSGEISILRDAQDRILEQLSNARFAAK